jgi:hypothetical protein
MISSYMLQKRKDSLIEAKEVRTESSITSTSYPPKSRWYYSFVIGNFHISFTSKEMKIRPSQLMPVV